MYWKGIFISGIQAPHTEAFLERTSAEGAKKISRFEKRLEGEEIVSSLDRANKLVFTDEHKRYLRKYAVLRVSPRYWNTSVVVVGKLIIKKYGQIGYQRTLSEIGLESMTKGHNNFGDKSRLPVV